MVQGRDFLGRFSWVPAGQALGLGTHPVRLYGISIPATVT